MHSWIPPFTVGQVAQILTQEHSCAREEVWYKLGYRLDLQQKGIDIIDTVREEMRDQLRLVISSMECMIVVATLLMLTGFGFVCEGTFPRSESDGEEYPGFEQYALDWYATCCALGQSFPLLALVVLLAIRAEAENCVQDVGTELSAHISEVVQWAQHDSFKAKARSKIPRRRRSSQRVSAAGGCCDDNEEEEVALSNFKHDMRLVCNLATGVLRRLEHFNLLFPKAQFLVFCALLSTVMTSSVMIGVTFCNRFPNNPWAWRCYSGLVSSSAVGCIAFAVIMRRRLSSRRPLQLFTEDQELYWSSSGSPRLWAGPSIQSIPVVPLGPLTTSSTSNFCATSRVGRSCCRKEDEEDFEPLPPGRSWIGRQPSRLQLEVTSDSRLRRSASERSRRRRQLRQPGSSRTQSTPVARWGTAASAGAGALTDDERWSEEEEEEALVREAKDGEEREEGEDREEEIGSCCDADCCAEEGGGGVNLESSSSTAAAPRAAQPSAPDAPPAPPWWPRSLSGPLPQSRGRGRDRDQNRRPHWEASSSSQALRQPLLADHE